MQVQTHKLKFIGVGPSASTLMEFDVTNYECDVIFGFDFIISKI